MWHSKTWSFAAAALVFSAAAANAQHPGFFDNFESHALGNMESSMPCGSDQSAPGDMISDGWRAWDGAMTTFAQIVNTGTATDTVAAPPSGTKFAEIGFGGDTINEFHSDGPPTCVTNFFDVGSWVLSAETYVPAGLVGKNYFIVLNTYNDFGPYEWTMQFGFNGATGLLECDCGSTVANTAPINFDAWTEARLELDLTGDDATLFYNGAQVANWPPSTGVFGLNNYTDLNIEAIDLYPDAPTSVVSDVYYDDIEIRPGVADIGTPFCFGDGSGTLCPCGNAGAPGNGCSNTNNAIGANLSASSTSGGASVSNDQVTLSATNMHAGNFMIFFQGTTQLNGGNGVVFGDGIRCAGGSVIRLNPAILTDGNGDASFTGVAGHPGQSQTGGLPGAGGTRHYQAWYRNGPISPCGATFNLSNGLTITWGP